MNEDKNRPGWSSTKGPQAIWEGADYPNEFGKVPCDQTSEPLDKLQKSWMQDPNKEDVSKRLDVMDEDAFVKYNANQASRAEIREFMTDAIETEMDKYLAEEADQAAFHPEARVFNYNSPEYGKPGSEKYKIGQMMALQLK